MLNTCHIILIITALYLSGFAMSVSVYHSNSPSSRCMDFLVLRPIRFIKLLSHKQGPFPISLVLSHGFSMASNLCIPIGNSKMKTEWTLLTVCTGKSRCGAQTIRHIHPHSAMVGFQVA
jgi:hypothetical protein